MRSRPILLALLLALAACPYFVDLDGSSIWDANEAFYVETPREMMERGDFVTPMFNYEPRLNKPVLSYWIVAGFYGVFGVSPGVQRIPIALAALVMIATAFFLSWAAWSPDDGSPSAAGRQMEAALWAALGLAVTPRLLMFARRIFIDIYITMFLGLTLLFFALAERYPDRRRLFLSLMYVSAGLGVMTKGPIAIVLPALAFGLYLLVYREVGRIRQMMLPAGALIIAAIVAPYCAALYVRHGWGPIGTFILGENVARYTEGLGVDATRPLWFYVPVIFSDSFPWSLFLIVAALAAMREWRRRRLAVDPAGRVRALLWLWIAVIVLFFTASAAKQDLYIFPIIPAVVALAGIVLARGFTGGVRRTCVAIATVSIVAGAGVVYLVGSPDGIYLIDGARLMGLIAVAGGVFVVAAALSGNGGVTLPATAALFIALDWIFVLRVLPGFERYKPVPEFARTLESRLKPDDVVLTYNEALPSLVFYLRRHVDPYFLDQEVIDRFQSGRTVYAMMSANSYRDIQARLGATCIIDHQPTFDVKLKNMLAQQPLPELVLITNKCSQTEER